MKDTANTKSKLINLLIKNKGTFVSGEKLAEDLGVSRAAIWKTIKVLVSEGYDVTSVRNKGYRLAQNSDIVWAQGISDHLLPQFKNLPIEVFSTLESTNDTAKDAAAKGAAERVVVACRQTSGKGRKGRSFFSPDDTGVYFSMLLKPLNCQATKAATFTTMAAVAVCKAIEKLSDREPKIKWVNDIFIDDLKVCGILTEAAMNVESGSVDYAVVGVGINAYTPKNGFPPELKQIAGAVFESATGELKNLLIAEVINNFMELYRSQNSDYVSEYRKRNLVIGKKITVVGFNEQKKATALDIDDECHLIVRYENGATAVLSSGEISIRL